MDKLMDLRHKLVINLVITPDFYSLMK